MNDWYAVILLGFRKFGGQKGLVLQLQNLVHIQNHHDVIYYPLPRIFSGIHLGLTLPVQIKQPLGAAIRMVQLSQKRIGHFDQVKHGAKINLKGTTTTNLRRIWDTVQAEQEKEGRYAVALRGCEEH